jgi:hypothetical protein
MTPLAGREGDRGRVVAGEQGGRQFAIHVSGAHGFKWGSQSPTTDLDRDDEGYPTSGYSPQTA